MYFLRKTYELSICLAGYWAGIRLGGGWGSGILLAFAGLVLSSYIWDWLARRFFTRNEQPSATKHFMFGLVSSVIVAGAAYAFWGKHY